MHISILTGAQDTQQECNYNHDLSFVTPHLKTTHLDKWLGWPRSSFNVSTIVKNNNGHQ